MTRQEAIDLLIKARLLIEQAGAYYDRGLNTCECCGNKSPKDRAANTMRQWIDASAERCGKIVEATIEQEI